MINIHYNYPLYLDNEVNEKDMYIQKKISILLLTGSDSSHSKKFIEGFSKREDIRAVYVFSLSKVSIISKSPKIHIVSHERQQSKVKIIGKITYYVGAVLKIRSY